MKAAIPFALWPALAAAIGSGVFGSTHSCMRNPMTALSRFL